MRPPNDERRPLDKDAAHCRETAKAADPSIVHPGTDNGTDTARAATPPDEMTRAERAELSALARKRGKLAKLQIEQRVAELVADVETQLSTIYPVDHPAWKGITAAAQAAVADADRQIAELCKEMGVPAEFRPSLNIGWSGRGESAFGSRRAELRTAARTRIDALAKQAKVSIDAGTLTVETQLVAAGLTTAAAQRFLETMPTPQGLMPLLDVKELQGDLRAAQSSKMRRQADEAAGWLVQ